MTDHSLASKPNRRDFLKAASASLAGGALALTGALPPGLQALPARPNLLIIISDQERYPQHWPAGWAESNLPNHERLAAQGLTFQRAFCNSSMCAPSRATLFTGWYPAQHGLQRTGTAQYQLPKDIPNMARMLAAGGYRVILKGKWHLSYASDGSYPPSSSQVAAYGFEEWVPTAAGEGTNVDGFGGGCASNDHVTAGYAVDFLNSPASKSDAPFALIVGFVNPHDVLAYPQTWNDNTCGGAEYGTTANFAQGINLSDTATYNEDLSDPNNPKPTAQAQSKALLASGIGVLQPYPSLDPRNYLNFYAQLHKMMDVELGLVLDALQANDLTGNTVIFYTSDHGEMGLAHGGLRQKMFNAYEETMHVPLIISNPLLFPGRFTTTALAALVDLMPTIASLAHLPTANLHFSGVDLTPLFTNPAGSVQDAVLFVFDDQDAGQAEPPPAGLAVDQPNHIRCLREANWKYARYYDPSGLAAEQHELYDLVNDPNEHYNLAGQAAYSAQESRLAAKLAQLEAARMRPYPRQYLPMVRRGT